MQTDPQETVSRARFQRERDARLEAERLLEAKSRELYEANMRLRAEARQLDAAVAERTNDLTAALERAETGTRIKTQFVANMSHEIRTPLNGVLGMAQALLAENLTDSQRGKLEIILESGSSLMALLNDVLDLSKIEAGKLEIAPTAGDLVHLLRMTKRLYIPRAAEKGVTLRFLQDDNLPERLIFDPVRVRQCVANLVSNAVKFTPKGSVELRASATMAADGGYDVQVEIADTGIGMSEETQARLFESFMQADSDTTRTYGGTGLGLAISRQIARLMGGDITLTSKAGVGSTFTLTFRAGAVVPSTCPQQAPKPEEPQQSKRSLRGARVLLVDDNTINRQVIRLFLSPHGVRIQEATNGREALAALENDLFDIVLLDVHMPVMDGCETIRRIRGSGSSWANIPVIALTADAMSGDRERFIALGMNEYVSKPVDQRELLSKMARLLPPASLYAAAS